MDDIYVRKIDILDLIMYHFKHYKSIILIILVGALLSGGFRFNQFWQAASNEKYVSQIEMTERKNASCMIYINGKNYNNSAMERIVNFGTILKSRDVVDAAMEAAGIHAPYQTVCGMISYSSVTNDMIEIRADLTLLENSTNEQAVILLKTLLEGTMKITNEFEASEYVTIIEQVHEGIYHEEEKTALDKKEEIIGIIKYCILGAVIGGAVSILLLCSLYLTSTALRTEEELCYAYGSKIIGRMTDEDKESIRKIKMAFIRESKPAALNVVSQTEEERRENVADTMAVMLAECRKKVILVKLVKTRNTSAKKGIYEYVSKKCALTDIITKGEKYDMIERLDAEEKEDFLAQAVFGELVDELKKMYDYVIFDSPACRTSADGVIVSAGCDKTILVAGRNCVREKDAVELRKQFLINNIDCSGIILTK